MRRSRWLTLLALLSAVDMMFLGTLGCTKTPETTDAGFDAGLEPEVDAGPVDAGPDLSCTTDTECADKVGPTYVCDEVQGADTYGTCVEKCRIDDDCEHYKLGQRCEENSGHCIAARGCNDDTNCPPQGVDPNDYCDPNGIQCRCVLGESSPDAPGLPGVCRRRHGVCEECTDDTQCGWAPINSVFNPPGRCLPLQGDPDGTLPDGGTRKYCFFAPESPTCGCGMTLDAASGTCVPQSHTCSSVGCEQDKDCPNGSVCNVAQCLCEPRCIWNFDRQDLNPPGCPPGKSCWVDPENLDPDSKYFGAGRCKSPCESDAMCQANDPRLVCKGEKVQGGTSDLRCRPGGECMDDLECPVQPEGAVSLGYCDRSDFTCKTDCRVGTDPVTNEPFDDCISGYKCAPGIGGAPNECKKQTCLELGGARLGCAVGEYCCGEDRNGDGTPEPCPLTGVDPDSQCYRAPSPPFCTQCMSNADCNQPGMNINNSPMPSLCIYAGDRPDGTMGVNICAPATFNDFTNDQNGVAKAYRGCPSKFAATAVKTKCMSNADCGPNGLCDSDPQVTFPDGGHPLACLCDADGTATSQGLPTGLQCPGDADAGSVAFCRFAPSGTRTTCIDSVICTMSAGGAYKPKDQGGCEF